MPMLNPTHTNGYAMFGKLVAWVEVAMEGPVALTDSDRVEAFEVALVMNVVH